MVEKGRKGTFDIEQRTLTHSTSMQKKCPTMRSLNHAHSSPCLLLALSCLLTFFVWLHKYLHSPHLPFEHICPFLKNINPFDLNVNKKKKKKFKSCAPMHRSNPSSLLLSSYDRVWQGSSSQHEEKIKKKKKKKITAQSIPMWSPTIVLTLPSTV